MKKNFFLFLLLGILISQGLMAVNKLVGGGMEVSDDSHWLKPVWNHGTTVAEFGYTADRPGSGSGGCFHIQGTGSDVQYAIYQAVELKQGVEYTPNAAVKIISGNATVNTWFEVYMGTTDPATTTADYTESAGKVVKSVNYFSWNKPPVVADGLLLDANSHKTYTPAADGTYYMLIKFGCNNNGSFEILVDDVKLEYSESPKANFKVRGLAIGAAPFEVEFENSSVFAKSYLWEFGDGETSTDENPGHVYESTGIYTVSLTVTGESSSDKIERQVYVVNVAGANQREKLLSRDMESQGNWFVSKLDGQVVPDLTWGYSEQTIEGGQGGCLRFVADGSNRKNMCIYQPVYLTKNHTYKFDMAFRLLTDGAELEGIWVEAYLENFEQPSEEYRSGSGRAPAGTNLSFTKEDPNPGCMGYIPTGAKLNPDLNNGLFSENLSVITYAGATEETTYPFERLTYMPKTTGTYLFILKIGGNSGKAMDLLFDNLSLIDPSIASSVPQIFTNGYGIYAESGMINVNTENVANNVVNIYSISGLLIESGNFSNQYVSKVLPAGLYIVKINGVSSKILVK